MDIPTSAVPDEKTPSPKPQVSKFTTQERSKASLENDAERISSFVARSISNSIDELQGFVSELQKLQEFLKSEVDSVQRQIDSALAGSISSSKPVVLGKTSRVRKHFHTAHALVVEARRQILSNAAASGSKGRVAAHLTDSPTRRRRRSDRDGR
jgi:uncharacterized protein YbaP (TraB family)